MKNKSYFSFYTRTFFTKSFLEKNLLIFSIFFSLFTLAQPYYRVGETSLNSTRSDESRLKYEAKNRRESLAQIKFHEFLSKHPKALYMMDQYESSRNKVEVEKAHRRTQRNDFFQNIVPVVSADISVQGRFGKNFNLNKIPLLNKLGVSAEVEGGISVSKTWTSEEVVRNYFSRQYVQDINGNIDSKINVYSRYLTHDIYECEKNPSSCRLNTDPAFQYLYQMVFKKDFPNFPNFERIENGERIYSSFEELKTKFSKSAYLVENSFNSNETLESQTKLKKLFLDQFSKENKAISERIDHLEKNHISQTLSDPDVTGQDPYVQQMDNEIKLLERSMKYLEDQYEEGKISEQEFQNKVSDVQTGIAQKELNIKVHQFHSDINTSQQWIGATVAFAQLVNAPKEVVQLGQATYAGMNIIKGLGPLFMGAAFDPTGITLAIAGVSTLMSIFSDTPNPDQLILNELSEIKTNQMKMINLLYEIDFRIEGLEEQLKKLEVIIETNHQELLSSFDDIELKLVHISDDINTLYEISKTNNNLIATQRTRDAGIGNMTEDYGKHQTLIEKYAECRWPYDMQVQLAREMNPELVELHDCLDSCLSKKARSSMFISCSDQCSSFEGEVCDSSCIQLLIEKKTHNRQMYELCRRDVNENLIKKESDVSGIYAEFRNYSNFPFVLPIVLEEDSENEKRKLNSEDESYNYREFIIRPAEERITYMPLIGSAMANEMSSIVSDNHQKQINQQLWNEDYLQQYKALLDLSSSHRHLLSNPKNFDESFLVYADTVGRLPTPGASIGINGETYSYPDDHLAEMCTQAQYIENISRVSRKNIQNAFILYKYEVNQLNQKLRNVFKEYLDELRKNYKNFSNKQRTHANSRSVINSENECNCDKDYSKSSTKIFNIIDEDTYPLGLFLSDTDTQLNILKTDINLNDEELINHGFYTLDYSHGECQKYKETGKPMESAKVTRPLAVQALKDTLEGVQEGEQGGCWFIDKYGLVTGEPGLRIQLYQKIDSTYTIEDQDFAPANNFKPMCSVFVTDFQGRWFFTWQWTEPTQRAICLEAELEFLYDGFGSDSHFFGSDSAGRIYYLDEESIQEGLQPQVVSAKSYMQHLIHKALKDKKISREDIDEEFSDKLNDVQFDALDGILRSYSDYRSVIQGIADEYVSLTDGKYSMRIDNANNEEDMDEQEWVNNARRIRDSVGSCKKFACLKNAPKYVPDKQGWMERAKGELEEASEKLGEYFNNILQEGGNSSSLDEIIKLQFYLDTLIKAGYGSAQLSKNTDLSNLSQFLNSIRKVSSPLLSIGEQRSLLGSIHISALEELDKILNNMESLNEFLPDLSLEDSGFGDPEKRTRALDMILNRDHLKPQACLYRKF